MAEDRIITKYDYLRYFTRISKFWFHSNQEIESYLQSALGNEEIEETEIYEEPEFEIFDFDELSQKSQSKDQKTAQMIEGNLIEERFVKFIQEEYPGLRLVDLRGFYEKEILVQKTKEAIANDNCIILQATFFSQRRKAVCKTDFLVVQESELILIEVKGTTTVKRKHFLDVFYQYMIADDAGFRITGVMMGLIKYERLKRGQISFVLTENCQLSKENTEKSKEKYLEGHGGEETRSGQAKRLAELSPTRFNLLKGIQKKAEFLGENQRSIKSWNDFWDGFWKEHEFDLVLQKLRAHEYVPLKGDMKPEEIDYPKLLGSEFYEYSPEIRAAVAKHDPRYQYSGTITSLRWRTVSENSDKDLLQLVEEEKNENAKKMVQYGTDVIDKKALVLKLAELKNKKVFFDFESINPAVRAADDTFPFQQVVTQCSVVATDDLNKTTNLIVDPQKITRQWWSAVVESIYKGADWSYVVYNKTFESSRLTEIKKILNEESASQKIKEINDNIYDLADIFDVRKKITALKALKGYYSIKKVLPLAISGIDRPLSKNYEDLTVQKGTEAMELTMKRHFGQMEDETWKKAARVLCQYCENDVLAMIDVLTFAKKLAQKAN